MKRIILLLAFFVSVFLTPQIYAAETETPWIFGGDYDASIKECIGGGNNAECWVNANLGNFMPNSLNTILVGISSDTIEKLMKDPNLFQGKEGGFYRQMQQRSVLGGTSRAIAKIYESPPASLAYWINDVGQTLGFIPKQAYAQGIGFSGLSALLPVWKAFRNIAYLILAVVMIVIGFMVMLRKKIDPKTVVTVQNALPRIVITLILITFSYAIVGFLIDLMYLLILLVVTVVGSTMKVGNIPELQAAFTAGGFSEVGKIFDPLKSTFYLPTAGFAGAASIAAVIAALAFPPSLPIILLVALVGGLTGGAIVGEVTGVGRAVGALSPILMLIIGISLLITLFRIFMILFNAYIQIIISLLFGPLQIMMDAIPGSNGFSSWFNNLIIHLITFPIVIALIIIGMSITSNITSPYFWSPPLVPKTPDSSQFIQALLSFGILMMIPSVVNGIKEALKIKPAIPLTAGSITQPIGAGWNVFTQGLSTSYYIEFLTKGQGDQGLISKLMSPFKKRSG